VSRRSERVGEQIRGELARLLRAEVTDPRIGLLTLTRVNVSPDLRHARVFWSKLTVGGEEGETGDEETEVAEGLESAAGFLRRRLAQILPLRRVPELRFQLDCSIREGAHTLALLGGLDRGPR